MWLQGGGIQRSVHLLYCWLGLSFVATKYASLHAA